MNHYDEYYEDLADKSRAKITPFMRVKKLHENAIVPQRAHDTDAGLDLFCIENCVIMNGKDAIIKTGISIALPDGWFAIVKEKSGLSTKKKLTVGACVIDSSYRGEVLIHLFNNDPELPVGFEIGDKIAQLVVVPCWCGQPVEVEELDETKRGEGGFGSTGDQYKQQYQDLLDQLDKEDDISDQKDISGEVVLPNGTSIFWEVNDIEGRTYHSDEVGGGVFVWDTALVNMTTLLGAIAHEAHEYTLREKEWYEAK